MEMRIYHLSAAKGISVLRPSMPAEDVIGGELKWADVEELPSKAASVSFTKDVERNLIFNPILKGYIYTPKDPTHLSLRDMCGEVQEVSEWVDFCETGELRCYQPVEVKTVGEFTMLPTKDGLRPKVKWYQEEEGPAITP